MSVEPLIARVRTFPGVLSARYNEDDRSLTLRYDSRRADVAAIESLVRAAGLTLRAQPAQPALTTPEEEELAALPWMIRLTVVCLVAVVVAWVVEEFVPLPGWVVWLLYGIAYVSGGYYSVQEAW